MTGVGGRERCLIVNADDFGASLAISEGIVHCHTHGILTSTSLMVRGKAAREAVAMAAEHPRLGLGLHWDLDAKEAPAIDLADLAAVRRELTRQLETFQELVGRGPTHIDSHHHIHREQRINPIARELAAPVGVPLRDDGRVRLVGSFYGQRERLVTDLSQLSAEALVELLIDEVGEGWTELSCHPGFIRGDLKSVYLAEREFELQAITDPRVRAVIVELGIRLANYADFAAAR